MFLVGLPRSGSTLLSRWVNGSEDVVAFNDLYYLQAVMAEDALAGTLDEARLSRLLTALGTVLRRYSSDDGRLAATVTLAPHQIEAIQAEVVALHQSSSLDWSRLMDETLSRAARAAGKSRWADKTPQNFLHIDLLRRAFPSARFVYLVRDPRRVLASYKHARGPGQDQRRYHPVTHALYWRAMARSCLSRAGEPDVAAVRYEDMLEDPEATAERLGPFLGTSLPPLRPQELATNSSFRSRPVQGLSGSETWVCERLCDEEMSAFGYDERSARPSLGDVADLAVVTARFAAFQAGRAITSVDGRRRMGSVAARALRR